MPDYVPLFYPGLLHQNNVLRVRLRMRLMTDDELTQTWNALWPHTEEDGNDYDGLTFNEWAEEVYSEMCRRDIKGV